MGLKRTISVHPIKVKGSQFYIAEKFAIKEKGSELVSVCSHYHTSFKEAYDCAKHLPD